MASSSTTRPSSKTFAWSIDSRTGARETCMARHRARRMGLEPIGTVGLLVLVHRRGLVNGQSAMTMIDTLVQTHGLYLSATILERVRATLARSN